MSLDRAESLTDSCRAYNVKRMFCAAHTIAIICRPSRERRSLGRV